MSALNKMLSAAKQQAGKVVPTLRGQLKWYDQLTGMPSGQMQATECKYGIVTYYGIANAEAVAQVGEGQFRVSNPHSYRLSGALDPGAGPADCDEWTLFLYEVAKGLGAPPPMIRELTNTLLTGFPLSVQSAPGFRTNKGVLITLCWPYEGAKELKVLEG